ncbi:glycosyltransferase [filamentous cyanobacterium LEGE 11480]|uniref:Glycosyltransferase n=1 Tax=Romeriopsis navalis LEGE 11480 TaxID=2777977 RepID=A0A928VMN0_9CYAN|nr:glycosyltransferase [Romeriopsis navalis]MBE9030417.1 glycosyltransferase [Romeriopsis navalis LEGE 11480]
MTDVAIFVMDLRGGGAERVMLNLADGLSRSGLKVDLVLVQAVGEYVDAIPPQLRVINLNCHRLVNAIPALRAYLQQRRPKALISALEDTNIAAIIAKHWSRMPMRLIVTVHNQLSQEVKHAQNLKRRFVPYLIRWVYPWADAVVGVSQGVVLDLLQFGTPKARTHAIYNPIITPSFRARPQVAIDHPWFAAGQPPVILGVGRLNEQKDFVTLIRAFAQVRQHRVARLMILGEGAERSRLESLVAELELEADVSLPGFVSNPYDYMAAVDVVALSSAWEGFGNVLVEAMAMGTPVVSTDCQSGPAEILENGQYGKLVPVKDEFAMATAILETLQQSPSPAVLKERANDFSLEKVLGHYQQLLSLSF